MSKSKVDVIFLLQELLTEFPFLLDEAEVWRCTDTRNTFARDVNEEEILTALTLLGPGEG